MATVKQARKKMLLQVLGLLVAAVIIVVGVVVFQKWANNRPGRLPQDISITATVGDNSVEIFPYLSCEPGAQCPEGTVPNLTVGADQTLVLEVPQEVSNHDWQVVSIYTDPAANNQQNHGPNDTTRIEIPGSVDPIAASTGEVPRLSVVEITSVLVGKDANNEETPVTTVWSLSTMSAEELA